VKLTDKTPLACRENLSLTVERLETGKIRFIMTDPNDDSPLLLSLLTGVFPVIRETLNISHVSGGMILLDMSHGSDPKLTVDCDEGDAQVVLDAIARTALDSNIPIDNVTAIGEGIEIAE
jgi:hypothetical protein